MAIYYSFGNLAKGKPQWQKRQEESSSLLSALKLALKANLFLVTQRLKTKQKLQVALRKRNTIQILSVTQFTEKQNSASYGLINPSMS